MSGSDAFERLNRLFDELVSLSSEEREAAIADRCGDDVELAGELRAMLSADDSGELDGFVGEVVSSEVATLNSPDATGQTLGSWRIVRPLAEGGMGTVYLAERADGAYEAKAAIKLVRGGIPSPALDAHLMAERQILASLSHPGIAQLIDGGSTTDRTPYLVMEYIDGVPITEWCETKDLGVDARLRLFLKVCESVSYAHGALVAHRDLKPSNILVTQDGEAKLLDFGIARIMDAIDEGSEGLTRSASLMTPAYASPEQVSGRRAGVASDVYALGVLLYELLAERLPLETARLTPLELTRVIVEEVPPLLSATVTAPDLRKRLTGDLDAIVSRALRKEPDQRYESVAAFAEDIGRHLEGLPVLVRRDDRAYRLGRLVRRNAGAASAALILVLAISAFAISSFVQARRIAVERDRAEAQRATAERVSTFLEEILTEADPNESSGQEITAREVLDRGSARVLTELQMEPDIQAALATVMGRVYRNLGEYDAAVPLLDSALAVRRRATSPAGLDLGESLLERGALAYDLGDYENALEMHRAARFAFEEVIEGDDQLIADAMDWMATSLVDLSRIDEAEEMSRQVLAMNRRLHSEPSRDLSTALINLADILREQGGFDEARELGQEALTVARAVHGDVHLEVAHALNQLASTLSSSRMNEEAIPLVQEGLAIRRTIFPEAHPETAASLGNLANILGGVGRFDEAEAARRESLAMMRSIFPDSHPYVAGTVFSLGDLLLRMARTEEAVATLDEAVALHKLAFAPNHPNVAFPLTSLGRASIAAGDFAAAELVLREAYTIRREGLPEGHWHVAASGLDVGRALDGLGREEEAEVFLREAFETLARELGTDDPRTGQGRDALREHYLRRGLDELAAPLGAGSGG